MMTCCCDSLARCQLHLLLLLLGPPVWLPLGPRVLVYETKVLSGHDLQGPPPRPSQEPENLTLPFCTSKGLIL